MSFKNNLVKTFTKAFASTKSEEQMLTLIETSGKATEYDENGFRITKYKVPEELTFTQYFYKDVRMEEMFFDGHVEDPASEKIVLLFHGGGYLGKLNDIYTEFMERICKAAKGYKVISVEYRTSRVSPFPGAYEDALTAWEYVMEKGYKPENIIIMGDSAGGGLGLVLAMHLRDQGVAVKAYMGLSPWIDLTCTSECFTVPAKKKTDPLFGGSHVVEAAAKLYVGEHDVHDWRISPIMGSFENLPKMYITYGDCEIFRDDIQALYDKAKETVDDVTLKVYAGCQHDIQTSGVPEAKEAWKDVEAFISSL